MAKGAFDPTAVDAGWFDDTAQAVGWFDGDLLDVAASGITGSMAAVEDADTPAFTGTVVTSISGSIAAVEDADAAYFVGTVPVTQVAYAGGYTVKVGRRRFKVDPLDSLSLKTVIDAVQDEAEEVAQVVEPVARPAVVARAQVAPVEVPKTNREDAKAFAKFLAQVRSEYEAAMRTAMIIRLMREAEDDDEEALLLLM